MSGEKLAAPCGLYCGICSDFDAGRCTGCTVGEPYDESCDIIRCARGRKLETCASCPELPCTLLIQFTADPIWRTHLPCIENLRRQREIGQKAWLEEQAAYWKSEDRRRRWLSLSLECERRRQVEEDRK
jgi:hypothetical protein